MSQHPLNVPTLNRLAFIRLLYRQAVEQCQQSAPLAAVSILTFHDTVEQFLILAAEHLRAGPVKRNGGLLQYWEILKKPYQGFQGVELSGLHGIARLNSVRNDLKHLGAMPSEEDITDTKFAVASFLEDNTPKVFGVELAKVSLVDVVPQPEVVAKLKEAAAADATGDYKAAMIDLAITVDILLNDRLREIWGSGFEFGADVSPFRRTRIGAVAGRLAARLPHEHQRRAAREAGQALDGHLMTLSQATSQIQRGLRVLALGIDYGQYLRFVAMTPGVHKDGGTGYAVLKSLAWTPTHEDYEECLQFVITTALRIADLEARAKPPATHA